MYTIMMNADKRLTQTVVTTLYQNENLVDKLKFIIPHIYEELNLLTFKVALCYTTPSGEEETEEIKFSNDVYKGKWACGYLPIDSKITRAAGDITLKLIFTDNNQRVLRSGATTIKIHAVDNGTPGIPNTPTDPDIVLPDNSDDSGGFGVVEF